MCVRDEEYFTNFESFLMISSRYFYYLNRRYLFIFLNQQGMMASDSELEYVE